LHRNRYLAIYLNDHLAGATGGIELARRLRRSNCADGRFREPLERICTEIEDDRAALVEVVERLGVSQSLVKPLAARAAGRLGRLKLNGQLRGYSPLSRVLELEGLQMGITGKLGLWRALAELPEGARSGVDLERLAARAEAQRSAVEDIHRLAVAALADAPHS
jgi:hypothetical protein